MAGEEFRKYLCSLINGDEAANDRAEAEARYGKVWDTQDLLRDFHVHTFSAPFVVVTRKADGELGCLTFQHMPRFYFDFIATPVKGEK